mgnify:CR=1 FL=1
MSPSSGFNVREARESAVSISRTGKGQPRPVELPGPRRFAVQWLWTGEAQRWGELDIEAIGGGGMIPALWFIATASVCFQPRTGPPCPGRRGKGYRSMRGQAAQWRECGVPLGRVRRRCARYSRGRSVERRHLRIPFKDSPPTVPITTARGRGRHRYYLLDGARLHLSLAQKARQIRVKATASMSFAGRARVARMASSTGRTTD